MVSQPRQDPLASTSAWSAKPTPRICDPDPQCPSGRQLHLPDDPPAMGVPQCPLFQNMLDPHDPYNSQGTSAVPPPEPLSDLASGPSPVLMVSYYT
ncbi:hypothetical protein PGB90_001400 [Kerria lacca]